MRGGSSSSRSICDRLQPLASAAGFSRWLQPLASAAALRGATSGPDASERAASKVQRRVGLKRAHLQRAQPWRAAIAALHSTARSNANRRKAGITRRTFLDTLLPFQNHEPFFSGESGVWIWGLSHRIQTPDKNIKSFSEILPPTLKRKLNELATAGRLCVRWRLKVATPKAATPAYY